jgi:hypothetical protein
MTLVASGKFKGCSRGRTTTSPERRRMVRARKATPVSLASMKRRSVGRSHAHRITRGIDSSRAAVVAASRLLISDRAFVNPKASEATSMVAPATVKISSLDCVWFMSRNCNRKAASVHQQITQKKLSLMFDVAQATSLRRLAVCATWAEIKTLPGREVIASLIYSGN